MRSWLQRSPAPGRRLTGEGHVIVGLLSNRRLVLINVNYQIDQKYEVARDLLNYDNGFARNTLQVCTIEI